MLDIIVLVPGMQLNYSNTISLSLTDIKNNSMDLSDTEKKTPFKLKHQK